MDKQIIIASQYQVIRKVGEGGMAKVYLAYDTIHDRNVALKILKKENVNPKKIKHFKKEAEALSLMDDENIVKIYDIGEEGNIHFIATEFIDGMTLKEYVTTCSPIPIEEVVEITRQVLLGLKHAHEKFVVHKDIKSQNILLDNERNIKITDFGIADVMDDDITRTQSLMGTPQYIAPEILNREELTEQSDLYSVGILMYEMLVGRAPFTGEKPAVIMVKQMNHPLPSIINQRADVPQSLENVVIKASAKKLTNRYISAVRMLEDLNTSLSEERVNEEKFILTNDILSEEVLEKTIVINEKLDYSKLKAESEKIQKNKKLKIIIFSVVSIFLVALVSLVILLRKPALQMPDLTNKDIQTAKTDLVLLGVLEEKITTIYEDNELVAQNTIIETTPKANTDLVTGDVIILKVSSGPEKKVLKDYKNSLASNAKNELEQLGYVVDLKEVDSQVASGAIISQTPTAGTMIAKGDKITFEFSSGSYEIEVPNFTNVSKEEAENWAKENQVQISSTFICNDQFAKNMVLSQEPKYKTKIRNGGSISVTISDGKCIVVPPTTPTPTPPDNKPNAQGQGNNAN